MATSRPYVCKRALSGREIRLLVISDMSDDTLQVRITYHQMDERPSFVALSYVWGVFDQSHELKCDGQTIHTSRTLHTALQRLKKSVLTAFDVPLLWVDAIYINQEDDVEKTEQVRMMIEIYANAQYVIGYLGDESEANKNASEMLDLLWTCLYARTEQSDEDFDGSSKSQMHIFDPYLDDLTPLGLPTIEDARWQDIRSLLELPWFTRVWIIQEYVSAGSFKFFCGEWVHDGTRIFDSFQIIERSTYLMRRLVSYEKSRKQIYGISTLNHMRSNKDSSTFLQCLMTTYSNDSSDPRDKIFAVVEIGPGCTSDIIDLSKSLDFVAIETALHILSVSPLALLSCSQFLARDPNCKLPSWVPTFHSRTFVTMPVMQGTFDEDLTAIHKCFEVENRHVSEDPLSNCHSHSNRQTLVVTCHVVDRISEVCPESMPNGNTVFNTYGMFARIRTALGGLPEYISLLEHFQNDAAAWAKARYEEMKFVEQLCSYPTGYSMFEIYWRSLIQDDDHSAPTEIADALSKFWEFLHWHEGGESIAKEVMNMTKLQRQKSTIGTTVASSRWKHALRIAALALLTYFLVFEWVKHERVSVALTHTLWRLLLCISVYLMVNFLAGFCLRLANQLAINRAKLKLETINNYFSAEAGLLCDRSTRNMGRRLCLTDSGYVAWGPQMTLPGDTICRVRGSRPSFVIRKCNVDPGMSEDRFSLVGDVYVHGSMTGYGAIERDDGRTQIVKRIQLV